MAYIDQPVKIGTMELDKRIIMPPVATYKYTEKGIVTDDVVEHYRARAASGSVSMIITEHCYVHESGKANPKQMSFASDEVIEGLARVNEAVHAYGVKTVAQLNHAGSATTKAVLGTDPIAPSAVVLPVATSKPDDPAPAEMTKEQIKEIVQAFADAAVRAKKAGYDGVEIHSAHAYLLNQFYSPLTNLRTDEYGGDLDARLTIHREVIAAVREAVGKDYPVLIRLGGCDYREGGSTIEDAVYASAVFEACGVDAIDLSGGMCRYTRPDHTEPGYFGDMSEAVKKTVNIPVILTGGVTKPEEAEALLAEEKADLIGVGRALFKNPSWPNEA